MSIPYLRQLAGTDQQGTKVLGIVEAAIALGFDAKGVSATYDSLMLSALPAIAHVITIEGRHHYVVIVQVDVKSVFVMDPATGSIKKIRRTDFETIWTGVAVLMSPGDRFRCNTKQSVTSRIWEFVLPQRNLLLLATGCAIVASISGLTISIYVKEIFDNIVPGNQQQMLTVISLFVVVAMGIQFLTSAVKNRLVLATGKYLNYTLVSAYYKHIFRLPQTFLNNMRAGEMLNRISDAGKITVLVHDMAVNIVVDVLVVVFSLVFMFYYNWKVASIIMMIIPVYAILYYYMNRINERRQLGIARSGAELDAIMVDSFRSVTTIRQLALENYFAKRVELGLKDLLDKGNELSRRQSDVQASADFASRIFVVILLWVGSISVMNDQLSTGELMSFYTLLIWFSGPVLYLLGANKTLAEARVAAARLFEIMELPPAENGWKKLYDLREMEVVCNNVHFSYPRSEPVLRGISLRVKTCSITGITGRSGSGKSTLSALLQGMYVPSSGTITIKGIPVSEIDVSNLRSIISSVPQHTDLFTATVAENIMIGSEADEHKLQEICERLDITGFTSQFPDGMSTMVTEQGKNLSGGQRQRIAIARALYKGAALVILDEATTGIDVVSEEKIMQTIEWYKNKGNTVIMITHSEPTLKICDNIVVLEDGVIR